MFKTDSFFTEKQLAGNERTPLVSNSVDREGPG